MAGLFPVIKHFRRAYDGCGPLDHRYLQASEPLPGSDFVDSG